jgi:hypothetical protein
MPTQYIYVFQKLMTRQRDYFSWKMQLVGVGIREAACFL